MRFNVLSVCILVTVLSLFPAARVPAGPPPSPDARVERQRILFYSHEYLRHAQYLRGRNGDVIVAWGWRIMTWPLDTAQYTEVVPEDPKFRFSNGSCVMDIDGDTFEELIVGRYARENHQGHEILWYDQSPGRKQWIPHVIGTIETTREMPHDILPLTVKTADGGPFTGIVLAIGRRDLFLFEKPTDPSQSWKQIDLGPLPNPPQSGMRVTDINRDGRPDIVTGMHWFECPENPRTGTWRPHRYGEWDKEHRWGSQNKHAIGDFDGDGILEMVVNEAENSDAKVAIFKQVNNQPDALWQCHPIDAGLMSPHTMEAADLNGDGRLDFLIGEMQAGGYKFPLNPNPKIYGYLNEGNLQFRKVVLAQGWGIHEGKFAPVPFKGKLLFFGNDTSQPWFDAQTTHLSTWTIEAVGR